MKTIMTINYRSLIGPGNARQKKESRKWKFLSSQADLEENVSDCWNCIFEWKNYELVGTKSDGLIVVK